MVSPVRLNSVPIYLDFIHIYSHLLLQLYSKIALRRKDKHLISLLFITALKARLGVENCETLGRLFHIFELHL